MNGSRFARPFVAMYLGCVESDRRHIFRVSGDPARSRCHVCGVREDVWLGQMIAVYGRSRDQWPI